MRSRRACRIRSSGHPRQFTNPTKGTTPVEDYLKPEWAVSAVSSPDPDQPGTRIVGFRVREDKTYPSEWLFRLQAYLRSLRDAT